MTKLGAIFCVFFRHSNIQNGFMGEFTCGRCGAWVGDSLAGSYKNPNLVIIDHNCKLCRENYQRLNWKDKFLAPKVRFS